MYHIKFGGIKIDNLHVLIRNTRGVIINNYYVQYEECKGHNN